MTFLLRYWLHILILGTIVLILGMAGRWCYSAGANSVRVEFAEHLAADKAAEAGALQDARTAEQDKAAELAAVAEQYEQDKRNDQAVADRLAAELRAGTTRLRDEWAGCETDRVSGTAASAAELDAARELRNAAAGAVVQVGRDADAKERALQAVIRADRGQ